MTALVVTRPQPEATAWVHELNALGFEAHALPMMVIAASRSELAASAVEAALAKINRYQAFMFVSANAVRFFFAALRSQNRVLSPDLKFWSPGPGTSKALRLEGVMASAVVEPAPHAAQFDSEHLWAQAKQFVKAGDAVLIVRGGDGHQACGQGRGWLAEQLHQCGVGVDFAPVYERQLPVVTANLLEQINALRAQQVIWLFSSSECLHNLINCDTGLRWGDQTALVTHPRIAQQAHLAGFGRVVQSRPTIHGITASIKSLHDHL